MGLKRDKMSEKDVDTIVEGNMKYAQLLIDNYQKEPTFKTKYKLIQFSRDLIIKTITDEQTK